MIFLSDLDRTLIFSYNRLGAENLCVEKKDGKELSYMTHSAAEIFSKMVKRITFIPITTRSLEQYNRIKFPHDFVPEYAIADNGANLLINGIPDKKWREYYDNICNECREELNGCADFLKSCPDVYFEVRLVDDTFIFTKTHTPDITLEQMRAAVKPQSVELFTNGDKIYAMPKKVSKDSALLRIKKLLGADIAIAAGDSLFDVDMLRAADIAVVKCGEIDHMDINRCQFTEKTDDPDFTVKTVTEILDRHKKM